MTAPTHEVATTYQYDAAGRSRSLATASAGGLGGGLPDGTWYGFTTTGASYNRIDELLSYSTTAFGQAARTYAQQYSTDGTRRLTASSFSGGLAQTWSYDGVGNRVTQTSNSGGCSVVDYVYARDNRLLGSSMAGCPAQAAQYFHDQTGNRLGQSDTLDGLLGGIRSINTYTAAGQLYFSLTPQTLPTYNFNWHWYDAEGRRVISHVGLRNTIWDNGRLPRPDSLPGRRSYYVYDGSDPVLVLEGPTAGASGWGLRQRLLVGGVDEVLAGRYAVGAGRENLVLVGDRQQSTLAAVRADGTTECLVGVYSRGAFGTLDGTAPSCGGGGVEAGSGFTGASTPNAVGGFTYLRNRWYDPATGRFLTQDPIGLAGGVNLYSYAANNPVAFSDPYGLLEAGPCDADKSEKENAKCKERSWSVTISAYRGWGAALSFGRQDGKFAVRVAGGIGIGGGISFQKGHTVPTNGRHVAPAAFIGTSVNAGAGLGPVGGGYKTENGVLVTRNPNTKEPQVERVQTRGPDGPSLSPERGLELKLQAAWNLFDIGVVAP